MSENGKKGDEHLFIHLISTFTQSAWVALGKLKNPITDKVEKNLEEAGFYIDMLDMVKDRMEGNLAQDEEKFMETNLGSLKLNYIEEKKTEAEKSTSAEEDKETSSESEDKSKTESKESNEQKKQQKKKKKVKPLKSRKKKDKSDG
ncbi:MAG: DUF1844 domain-containing protein [Candidatus Marinimicrobia bacterium]|nr:DUF1844 domain-containing protein [Candidatus Neomarinimicrobiota bacterium]